MKQIQIIHDFAAWIVLFELQGRLKDGIHTGELWQLVAEAQKVDWDLKKSLHTLAYRVHLGEIDAKTALGELNKLAENYEKEE